MKFQIRILISRGEIQSDVLNSSQISFSEVGFNGPFGVPLIIYDAEILEFWVLIRKLLVSFETPY